MITGWMFVAVLGSAPAQPVVLVELFTSQGCSSCPPADEILSKLDDPEVIPLSFHVDYWNYIGWKDPFSNERWSKRQQLYAGVLGERRVYTPQLVIDGRTHVVGSRKADVNRAIAKAKKRKERVSLKATGFRLEDEHLVARIEATAQQLATETDVYVAVYENGLSTRVQRGENAGRKLANNGVVRELKRVMRVGADAEPWKSIKLPVKKAWNRQKLGIVVFAVDVKSMAVDAAVRLFPVGS